VSQDNVELVRDPFRALHSDGIEAALSFFAPDCVWYTTDRWPEDVAYRGREGMRRLTAAFSENFDRWEYEVQDARVAGDRVVVLSEMRGQIKNAGAPVSQSISLVVSDFHDGVFGEIRAFTSWQEALEAVGLAE